VTLAEGLGTDVQAVYDYIIPKMQINLQGLNAEQIDEAMQAFFANLTDVMAEDLFGPIIKQHQQVGEGLYETAVRLVMEKEILLSVLDMTRQSFEGTAQEAVELSQALIDIAGDLETITDAAESYYDTFFTDVEKQVDLQKYLSEAFAQMNLILPDTRQGFRDLVEGLHLNTEAGREMYVTLLQLAEASGKYYDALEDAIKQLADLERSLHETSLESKIRSIIDDFNDAFQALATFFGLVGDSSSDILRNIKFKTIGGQKDMGAKIADHYYDLLGENANYFYDKA